MAEARALRALLEQELREGLIVPTEAHLPPTHTDEWHRQEEPSY